MRDLSDPNISSEDLKEEHCERNYKLLLELGVDINSIDLSCVYDEIYNIVKSQQQK